MTNKIPEIKVDRVITHDAVRNMCVKHDLYTCGTIKEFSNMLEMIDDIEDPTPENLYILAKDIEEHSDEQTISNIMFLLEKDAVYTCFEIED